MYYWQGETEGAIWSWPMHLTHTWRLIHPNLHAKLPSPVNDYFKTVGHPTALSTALTPRNCSSISPCICMPPKRWVGMQSGASWLKGQCGFVKATKPKKLSRTWPAVISQVPGLIRAKGEGRGFSFLILKREVSLLPLLVNYSSTGCPDALQVHNKKLETSAEKQKVINQPNKPAYFSHRSLPTSLSRWCTVSFQDKGDFSPTWRHFELCHRFWNYKKSYKNKRMTRTVTLTLDGSPTTFWMLQVCFYLSKLTF